MWNNLLCVEWVVKPYTLSLSVIHSGVGQIWCTDQCCITFCWLLRHDLSWPSFFRLLDRLTSWHWFPYTKSIFKTNFLRHFVNLVSPLWAAEMQTIVKNTQKTDTSANNKKQTLELQKCCQNCDKFLKRCDVPAFDWHCSRNLPHTTAPYQYAQMLISNFCIFFSRGDIKVVIIFWKVGDFSAPIDTSQLESDASFP